MTDERRIQLVAEVDATGTRAGFNAISREAGTMAAAVARSSQQAETAVSGVGGGAGRSAAQIEGAQRNLIGSIQRTTAALEAGTRTGAAYYEVLARQRGVDPTVLEPYLAQLRAVEVGQQRATTASHGSATALSHVGLSAAQVNQELRYLPGRISTIADSISAGQQPITIMVQQGGELVRMFGGVGAAAKAVGGYVLGLVNPYTLAAVAAAGLAYAYHQGSVEATAYSRAIILSGNASGTTADQLSETARRIGEVSGSRGAAAEALAGLVNTGKVSADNLQRFATVAVESQRVLGLSVADTTKEFSELGKAPLASLDKIGDKYHFITSATYAQVKALQDEGRMAEAANVAQNAFADGIAGQRQKVLDSLTDWERGWLRIKKAISGAIDATLDIGRGATNFEKINSLLQQRETIESNMARAREQRDDKTADRWQAELDQNKKLIDAERAKGDVAKDRVKTEATTAARNEAEKKWLQDGDKYLSRKVQLEEAITKARNEGAAAGKSAAEIEKRVSDIRKGFADIFNDGINSNIEALKRRAAVEDVLSRRAISQVAFNRSSGSVTEDDAINQTAALELRAFDQKRMLLEQELRLAKGKQNSLKEQAELSGQIAVVDQERISRQIQLTQDIFALEQKRYRLSAENNANLFDQAMATRIGLAAQVRDQLDYNEAIGRTASEILSLTAARREELAVRADQNANIAEGMDLTGEKAEGYRREAAALRERTSAERAGFVKQRDPWVNLQASVKKYGEEASNVGGQIGDAMTNAFKNAEDAFVGFVTTGKISFSSLATSILADLARIQVKKALAGFVDMAIGSLFGQPSTGPGSSGFDGYGNTLAGARASGGPVMGGASYLVGEKGPEVFTPSGSGNIIPNHQLGGGGQTIQISLTTNVTAGGGDSQASGDNSAQGRGMAEALNAKVKALIMQETRQGGILWNQGVRGAT